MNKVAFRHSMMVWLFLVSLPVAPAGSLLHQFEILNPKTYRSPGGRFELTVDPSDRYGAGEANYRCRENGQDRWTKTIPFTLWDAVITDDGMVAGYAYTQGPEGSRDPGEFAFVIVDADGKIQLKDARKREQSRFLHRPPNPFANGIIVDQHNDRVIVRVADSDVNRGHESWWIYQLSTAAALQQLVPVIRMDDSRTAQFILDAKPVAGTPLTLVHWWRHDSNYRNQVGALFTLIDRDANPVWKLELPNDYTVPGDEEAEEKLRRIISQRGGILRNDQPARFDLLVAAEATRKTFAVQNIDDQWQVKEVARSTHDYSSNSKPPADIPVLKLEHVDSFVLKSLAKPSESSVRKVRAFTFDGTGRAAYLRYDGEDQTVFVQVDQSGKLLAEIPINVEVNPDSQWTGCAWVGGTRFVLTNSELGIERKSRAWWLDTETRSLKPIAGFDCPPIDRLVGFSDGGFVALATMRFRYTRTSSIIAFDKQGKRIWVRPDDYNLKGDNSLFSVQDIARTSRDEIVVLENIPQKVNALIARVTGNVRSIWPKCGTGFQITFQRLLLILTAALSSRTLRVHPHSFA